MCPLLQNLAQPEHEHDRPGGIEIPPDHGNGHGCGIQHGNAELAVEQGGQALFDVFQGFHRGNGRHHRQGQEELGKGPAANRHGELFLKFPVQSPGGVVRHQVHGLSPGKGEGCQSGNHCAAAPVIADHRVLGAVVDRHVQNIRHIFQIIFQHIRLMQAHPSAVEMDAHPASGFM